MSFDHIKRVKPGACPACGWKLDAIGSHDETSRQRGPQPGDAIACIHCGAVMTINDQDEIRGFTPEEIEELENDAQWQDAIARLVGKIHFVKHAQN